MSAFNIAQTVKTVEAAKTSNYAECSFAIVNCFQTKKRKRDENNDSDDVKKLQDERWGFTRDPYIHFYDLEDLKDAGDFNPPGDDFCKEYHIVDNAGDLNAPGDDACMEFFIMDDAEDTF